MQFIDPSNLAPHELGTRDNQLFILLAFIVNAIIQVFRERSQRKWQREEAQRQERLNRESQQELRQMTEQQTKEIRAATDARVLHINRRLDSLIQGEGPSGERRRKTDKTQDPN